MEKVRIGVSLEQLKKVLGEMRFYQLERGNPARGVYHFRKRRFHVIVTLRRRKGQTKGGKVLLTAHKDIYDPKTNQHRARPCPEIVGKIMRRALEGVEHIAKEFETCNKRRQQKPYFVTYNQERSLV
ncbi:MAG: hypothetical protein AVW05_01690 [Hadesarchaea archaeon DG-33]|nr:MAG: hypothetical protein AVW05_01690 [Hadesarchaea archaeon DG-33]